MRGCRIFKTVAEIQPVLDFLEDARKPVNPLYAEGWCRVGCVGCPMAGKEGRELEFARWPKYKNLYMLAFRNMLEERASRGKYVSWQTPMDVYNWWMEYDVLPDQIVLDGFGEDEQWLN